MDGKIFRYKIELTHRFMSRHMNIFKRLKKCNSDNVFYMLCFNYPSVQMIGTPSFLFMRLISQIDLSIFDVVL